MSASRRFARLGLVAAGLAGAVLVIDAEFSSLRGVRALAVDLDRVSAGAQHYYALAVIGLAGILILWRGGGRSPPPAIGGPAPAGRPTPILVSARVAPHPLLAP